MGDLHEAKKTLVENKNASFISTSVLLFFFRLVLWKIDSYRKTIKQFCITAVSI